MKNAKGKRYKRTRGDSDPEKMVKWLITRLYEERPRGGYKSTNDLLKQLAIIQEREDAKPKVPHQSKSGGSYTFPHIQVFFNKNKKYDREDIAAESPFREQIPETNEKYIKEQKLAIDKITKIAELDNLKKQILEQVKDYEAKTGEELVEKLDEKKAELQIGGLGAVNFNRLKGEVNKAKTVDDLNKIDWNILPDEKDQKEIRQMVSDKETAIIGSAEEKYAREAAREIRDIVRLEDISKVTSRIIQNGPTSADRILNQNLIDSRTSLSDLLVAKRDELKKQQVS